MSVHKKERVKSTRRESSGEVDGFEMDHQGDLPEVGFYHAGNEVFHHIQGRNGHRGDQVLPVCCCPIRCLEGGLVNVNEDAVKVLCNNDDCTEGEWMHRSCFEAWESQVLNYLKSCGRARSWSEKQKQQNLWTKKGYDLAYRACDCKCGRGHLRKDLDYVPSVEHEEGAARRQRRHKKHNAAAPLVQQRAVAQAQAALSQTRPSLAPRVRHNSCGESTGSSSPESSLSSSPNSPPGQHLHRRHRHGGRHFDFFHDAAQAAAGNIFHRRTNLDVFSSLPRDRQNPYHIKMEDDGLHGNDETRGFVLTSLSRRQATAVDCALCGRHMQVYDRYPLVDGTLYLSPERHSHEAVTVAMATVPGSGGHTPEGASSHEFLNAVCMWCMEDATSTRCRQCYAPWIGRSLLLGSMYAYDIFAAMPCCQGRLTCRSCSRPIVDARVGLPFFSCYSRNMECPRCKATRPHFVRPLEDVFVGPRKMSL